MKQWCAVKGAAYEPAALSTYDRNQLSRMREAGEEVRECYRVLEKGGVNTVGEVLKGAGTFYEEDHYPEGDVFDEETASQYYYHAHRGIPGEHGHFHTFVRVGAIPDDMAPFPYQGEEPWPSGDELIAHLGAVSMDGSGYPLGFFMTNRWVTGETWYRAPDVARLVPHFKIDHAAPSWATNRWLSALLMLFHPVLTGLLNQRDEVLRLWAEQHPDRDVFEDRELEITGWARISVDDQIAALDRRLG